MRFLAFLPFASLAAGFVIVDEQVLKEFGKDVVEQSQNAIDLVFEKLASTGEQVSDKIHETGYDVEAWLAGSPFASDDVDAFDEDHPPHHKPPHHKPPHHGKPHHPPHHHKSNLTIYQLISKNKYTTKLAELINEYPDLVDTLNGTKANYTLFAPTDEAFKRIPDHGKKPSKEFIKDVLLHHVSDEFYPAGRVLHSYTIPTLYQPKNLGNAQRLTVRLTLHGPAINFYSKLVAVDLFGSNGVIHGVDHIIVPPPQVLDIISFLPGEFSTFELAVRKTELWDKLNSTTNPRSGGTLFVPSNFAFKKLGPKINAFLFSKFGTPYLKALLKYHMVKGQTLYTDAFFGGDDSDDDSHVDGSGYLHYDLPTVLGKPLAVDVIRRGPFVFIHINGFTRVTIHDGVASDGVIQVVSSVLIPPKKSGAELVQWQGEELTVDDFKERFDQLTDSGSNFEL